MLELMLFGGRLLVLRGPVSIALLAAVMIGLASSGTALTRALKKKLSRIDQACLIGGALFGLIAIQLRAATSLPASPLMTVLHWISALSIGAAAAAWAAAASAAITRRRPLALSGEQAILELRGAIERIEVLAARSGHDAQIAARLDSLRQLRASIERGVLAAACRAPLDRVLRTRSEIPQSLEKAELARARVRAHLGQLVEARELIACERDGGPGSVAERIGAPAAAIADDALAAVDAIHAAYEKLEQQLSTHLLRTEVDRQAQTALRLVHPLSDGIVSDRTAELQLAEQIVAAAELSDTVAVALNAQHATAPLERALAEAAEVTQKAQGQGTFREVLASLRE